MTMVSSGAESALQRLEEAGRSFQPFPTKMARMAGIFGEAAAPLERKGDEGGLSALRMAVGVVVHEMVMVEIRNIRGSRALSVPQKRQHLQEVGEAVEGAAWLGERALLRLRVDLSMAEDALAGGRQV